MPNLQQLQINPPQPATMKLQGMEYQRRREETDLRKDYMRLATDKFTQQIMEQERNFGAGKAEWEFEKTIKAMDFAAKNATSEDEFNETVEKISGTNPKVEWKGPDVELTFQAADGKKYKMKGKREVVYDAMDAGAKDISWFSDPEKAAQVSEYMRKAGVIVEPVEVEALAKEAAATLKHQRAIELKKTPSGTKGFGGSVTLGPDGATTVQWGSGGAPMTTGATTQVQKEVVKIDNALERTSSVIDSYRGDYQTFGTRWGNKWNAFKEKSGLGTKITAQDKEELGAFSTFRKRAVKDLGLAIHDLAGSTVSRNEEGLFKAGLPNPGTGLMDGDSPTEFEAALVDSYTFLLKSKARHMWYLKQGLGDSDIANLMKSETQISLAETMNRINEFGEQKLQEVTAKNPEINQVEAKERVKTFLKAEFGLEF